MSNDKPQQPAPARAEPTQLTRVPVKHLFFVDPLDLPGMQVTNLRCYADPPQASKFAECVWLPAWQTFEITFHPGPNAPDIVELIPAARVKKWLKA